MYILLWRLVSKPTLTQKSASLLHSLSLENPAPDFLQSYLDPIVSFTLDMGVELQIPNLVAPLDALMPLHWKHAATESFEGMELDVMDASASKAPRPIKHLFSRAIPLPGVHIYQIMFLLKLIVRCITGQNCWLSSTS